MRDNEKIGLLYEGILGQIFNPDDEPGWTEMGWPLVIEVSKNGKVCGTLKLKTYDGSDDYTKAQPVKNTIPVNVIDSSTQNWIVKDAADKAFTKNKTSGVLKDKYSNEYSWRVLKHGFFGRKPKDY